MRVRALPHLAVASLALGAGMLATACSSDGTETVAVEGEVDETTTVLFVRGAEGTGGLLVGGDPIHLSDIDDTADTPGFGSFAELLRGDGFEVEQVIEGPEGVDFAGGALDGVDVLVLGSNNAEYDQADIDAVTSFVRAGGGLLAFNDANYSTDSFSDAPSSDNGFLAPFDLRINQDDGTAATAEADDTWATGHPVLEGVDSLVWFGAGAVTVSDDDPSVTPLILVPMTGDVMEDAEAEVSRPPDPDTDAAVAVVEFGGGRVAAVLDRDVFFNGGSASLDTGSNEVFAANLIEWLAGRR